MQKKKKFSEHKSCRRKRDDRGMSLRHIIFFSNKLVNKSTNHNSSRSKVEIFNKIQNPITSGEYNNPANYF